MMAKKEKRTNEEIREISGSVNSSDPLVSFLYRLMRDEIPVGRIELLITEAVNYSNTTYTNGWLAQYAVNLAESLRGSK